jgi:hypothetical protein
MRKSRSELSAKPVFDVVAELSVGDSSQCEVIFNTAEAVDRILEGRHHKLQRRNWGSSSSSIVLQFDRVYN